MRRKAVTLTPTPAPLCLPQAVNRFQQATLILQQIAARLDAEEKGRAKEEGIAPEINAVTGRHKA